MPSNPGTKSRGALAAPISRAGSGGLCNPLQKLPSFSGSDLAASVCLQPSEMASVSQDSDSFFAFEMQKVLLDVTHLCYKVSVVIDHLFVFFIVQDVPQTGPDSCLL